MGDFSFQVSVQLGCWHLELPIVYLTLTHGQLEMFPPEIAISPPDCSARPLGHSVAVIGGTLRHAVGPQELHIHCECDVSTSGALRGVGSLRANLTVTLRLVDHTSPVFHYAHDCEVVPRAADSAVPDRLFALPTTETSTL